MADADTSRPVVEIAFAFDDATYPFVAATREADCVIELVEMVPRREGEYAEFFSVSGIEPSRVEGLAASYDTIEVSVLQEFDDGGLFEFQTSGNCPAYSLAELGALPREAVSVDGEGRVVAEIPPHYDPSAVVEGFLAENPDAELRSKREKDTFTPLLTESAFGEVLRNRLTSRQLEVLRAAYEAGYYEWPRGCTGEDVASGLGISSATFSEHVHAAERKLLTLLFDPSTR